MKKSVLTIFVISIFVLSSCNKSVDPIIDPPAIQQSSGAVIVSEGLFSQNNSSIAYYSLKDKTVNQNVYAAANGNAKLGDTANDMQILGNKGYIAVDQSFKIEIIDVNSFKSLGMIDLSTYGEPREISIVDSTMGFVTVWNSNGDGVVNFNPSTMTVTNLIKVGAKPEGIANNGKYLFVANSGWGADSTVSVINAAQSSVVKTLTVGINPNSVIEKNGDIYVVSTGSYSGSYTGGIFKIDPSALTVTTFKNLPGNPGDAAVAGDAILVINGSGIIKLNSNNLSITDSTFIKGSEVNPIFSTIYSIAYDSSQQKLFLGNPKDFQQNGEVVVYDVSGSELSRFDCGINPGTIVIKN